MVIRATRYWVISASSDVGFRHLQSEHPMNSNQIIGTGPDLL